MMDRTELLEAALDCLPEGMAIVGAEGGVAFWNQAAEAITGYTGAELIERPIPHALELLLEGVLHEEAQAGPRSGRGAIAWMRHKLGHDVPAMVRTMALRDGMGGRLGTAVIFHPAESLDALPRGESGEGVDVKVSQADLEDRLMAEFEDFASGGPPFGALWIAVDQAQALRKTHGAAACEAMLGKVERALAQGLRPAEDLGRWGDDEFLIISHERTPEMLAAHAQRLAGLARTAEFRWWGDRVSLTVSIGAAQAQAGEPLARLLERARDAMATSADAGGNRTTPAQGGQLCLPS